MIVWPVNILQNKYTRWYEQIIDKAKEKGMSISKRHAKRYDGYTEVHHIIPRAFGGPDTTENLVRFSAREHFICHWLLTKMTTGSDRNKMLTAFVLMTGKGSKSARYEFKITSSRVFEQIRTDYADYVSKKFTGREISQETRKKLSIANTGKTHTEEWKQRMSLLNMGRPGPVHTAEGREKIGRRSRGKTYQELYGAEYAEILKEKCKHVGNDNGFYGKTHSEETRLKFKAYYDNPETKKFKSELVKGDKNPAKRPEVKEKISHAQRERLSKQKLLGIGHYDPDLMAKRKELSQGSNNGNAKKFIITHPNGTVVEVVGGFKKYCKDNQIPRDGILRAMRNGLTSYKGYTIVKQKKDS